MLSLSLSCPPLGGACVYFSFPFLSCPLPPSCLSVCLSVCLFVCHLRHFSTMHKAEKKKMKRRARERIKQKDKGSKTRRRQTVARLCSLELPCPFFFIIVCIKGSCKVTSHPSTHAHRIYPGCPCVDVHAHLDSSSLISQIWGHVPALHLADSKEKSKMWLCGDKLN